MVQTVLVCLVCRNTACRRDARRPPRDSSNWFGATKESEVAAGDIVPVQGAQFEETLASASPDGRRRGRPVQRGVRGGHA
jgi:hypothetical protein